MKWVVRIGLAGLIGLVAVLLSGCAGGLGEGGDGNVGPQTPPNFNHPIYQGRLSGKVTFETGFLHHGIMSRPASGGTTGAAVLDRDRAFYRGLTARVFGPKGKKKVKVQEDGSFDFETVRRGDYTLEVSGPKGLLASCPVSLEGKSRMQVVVRVLGQDYADLNHNGNRTELVVEQEITYASDLIQFRRVIPPVGDVRTYLEDGSVEVLGADGYVKVFGSDGQIDYRFDPNNRFVDEELERETGQRVRTKSKERQLPKDPLAAKVSGVFKAPLVMSVSVSAVSAARDQSQLSLGDLGRLEVKVDNNGGTDITDVTAVVYGPTGAPQKIALVDDGGENDRRPDWPGLQSSLDRRKNDGVYTFPLLLDARTYRFLSSCQIIVTARNVKQLTSRPASYHLYLPAPPKETATPGTVAAQVSGVRVIEQPRGSNTFRAEVRLKGDLPENTTTMFLGPQGFRRLLAPVGDGSRLSCTSAALTDPGIYTVLLSDPLGDLFYASFRRLPPAGGEPTHRQISRDDPPEPAAPRPRRPARASDPASTPEEAE